jgi:AraC-like DNA-binding protein
MPHTLLALCTAGRAEIQIRGGGAEHRLVSVPGRLFVLGRGYELESVSWSGTCELLCAEVRPSRLGPLIEPDDNLAEEALAPQFAISEPQLASLLFNMRAEIEAGCPAGRFYGESVSLAMAAYLSGRYPATSQKTDKLKSTLSAPQLLRVRDYIHAHLSSDLGLTALAGEVQLSPYHFAHLFKNTVGMPPHHSTDVDHRGRHYPRFHEPESFHGSLPEGDRDDAQALPTRALRPSRLRCRRSRDLPAPSPARTAAPSPRAMRLNRSSLARRSAPTRMLHPKRTAFSSSAQESDTFRTRFRQTRLDQECYMKL